MVEATLWEFYFLRIKKELIRVDILDSYLRGDSERVINREVLLQILSQLDIFKSGWGKTLGILFFDD